MEITSLRIGYINLKRNKSSMCVCHFPNLKLLVNFKYRNFNPVNYEIKMSSYIRSIDRTYNQFEEVFRNEK